MSTTTQAPRPPENPRCRPLPEMRVTTYDRELGDVTLAEFDRQTAQAAAFPVLAPLVFASTAFIPILTMPGWLQSFVNVNPVSHLADATRALMVGEKTIGEQWYVESAAGPVMWSLIWAGIIVGFVPMLIAWVAIQFLNQWTPVELRESANAPISDLRKMMDKPESELPSFIVSLAPIILPILLISLASVFDVVMRDYKDDATGFSATLVDLCGGREGFYRVKAWVDFIGNKNIALVIGAGVAMFIMSLTTLASLERTQQRYYDQYRFADVKSESSRRGSQIHTTLPPRAVVVTLVTIPDVAATAAVPRGAKISTP